MITLTNYALRELSVYAPEAALSWATLPGTIFFDSPGVDVRVFANGAIIKKIRNAVIHYFVNDITPTVDSVLTDFVEATYQGYFPFPVAWDRHVVSGGAPQLSNDGTIFVQEEPQFIYGLYITDVTGTILLGAKHL